MTEQCEHEWRRYIDHERYYALFICDKPDCNAELSMQEAEIVLNKHAALKRENEALRNAAYRYRSHSMVMAGAHNLGEELDALLTAEEQE